MGNYEVSPYGPPAKKLNAYVSFIFSNFSVSIPVQITSKCIELGAHESIFQVKCCYMKTE